MSFIRAMSLVYLIVWDGSIEGILPIPHMFQDLEDARHEAESLRGILAELDAQNDEQDLMEARHEIENLKSTIKNLQDRVIINNHAPKFGLKKITESCCFEQKRSVAKDEARTRL